MDQHINELLTYSCHFMNNSTIENIKKGIEFFYSEEEVINAKKILWEISSSDLDSTCTIRKSTNKRTGTAANIDDIFEALVKLDSLSKLPNFVAKDLSRIPDRQPEEYNSFYAIERVSSIEMKMN